MKRLLAYLKPHLWAMLGATLLVLFIIVVELYRPIIIGDAIDHYINNPALSADEAFFGLLLSAGLYLVMLLLGFVFNALDTWMLQKLGQQIIYRMREEVFTHIHSLSLSFFNTTPVGKLVTRVSNDTEAINELFTTILVRLFKNVVKILGYAVVMVSISPRMALVSFALLPVVAGLTFFFRYLSRRAYQITRNKITEINTFLSEHLSGMKLIQIFAREEQKYREFEHKSEELYRANWREVMTFAIFRPMIYLLSIAAMVLVIGTGSHAVLNGTLSMGTLFIFITYISNFFEPIQELAEQFGTLQSSLASAEKVFSILDEKPQIEGPVHPVSVNITGRIEFKHVWFAYDAAQNAGAKEEAGMPVKQIKEEPDYILKDVSFVIEPGEKVAFVGATGAGKSTILNLIGRYFDIQQGEILIDGVNIADIDTDVLRTAIGQVQQDVFIFTGDIKNNISLYNEQISPERIKNAAHIVHADTFIEKMPGGFDAPVTERGSTLSAGQRQLLSFARTLVYDPVILVLDEATANIDTETESLITKALEVLMEGRTTIMVAHRLSTIQHADNIIVLDHGQIMESGTHQELLQQDGVYKKLYELQLLAE